MKKTLIIVWLIFYSLHITALSQKLTKPELAGRWSYESEDYAEFAYRVNNTFDSHLSINPNGRIIVRLCSKSKLPAAILDSSGFAVGYFQSTKIYNLPEDKVFFATSSKCTLRTDEYWFVPENTTLDYDEIVLANKVKTEYFTEEYDEKREPQKAKKEFADNTKKFIEKLHNNPKAEGFIIRNQTTKNYYLQQTLQQIQKQHIDKSRYHIIKQKAYRSDFPELMIIFIND